MFKIVGTIIEKSNVYQVVSKKQKDTAYDCIDFVVQYENDGHNNVVQFKTFGGYARQVRDLALQSKIRVEFHPQSNKSNDRWYTNLRVTKVFIYKRKGGKYPESDNQLELNSNG